MHSERARFKVHSERTSKRILNAPIFGATFFLKSQWVQNTNFALPKAARPPGSSERSEAIFGATFFKKSHLKQKKNEY